MIALAGISAVATAVVIGATQGIEHGVIAALLIVVGVCIGIGNE